MTYEENIANNARLKAEWLSHSRQAVDGGWYLCEARPLEAAANTNPAWGIILTPEFVNNAEYRITKTPKHPEYIAPPKMVKVEFEVTEETARLLLAQYEAVNSKYDIKKDFFNIVFGLRKSLGV